ncbi:hypothetical protein FKP32DRAFT_73421 [Trametes sanguinea]|nr:hypothetical protein FKP32DRAFT_73421 [Trametes sanguinea]
MSSADGTKPDICGPLSGVAVRTELSAHTTMSRLRSHPAILQEDILHLVFQYFSVAEWHPLCLGPVTVPGDSVHTFRHVEPGCTENERLRSLVHSALVCTSFRDAALRVLWGNLYDITPLLALLSSCVKTPIPRVQRPNSACDSYSFKLVNASVSPDELEQLTRYGAMVRTIAKHHGYWYQDRRRMLYQQRIDPDTSCWAHLRAILAGSSGQHLLPNLRRLVVHIVDASDFDLVPAVASSALLDLELVSVSHHSSKPPIGWQRILEQKLPVYFSIAPDLTRFRSDFGREAYLSNALAASIAQATSLRTLDMRFPFPVGPDHDTSLLWKTVALLSPLRNIQRLYLHHPSLEMNVPAPTYPSKVPSAPLFPNLEDIDIDRVDHPSSFYRLCELLQSPSVRRLYLSLVNYKGASDFHERCSVIARCFPLLSSFSCTVVPERGLTERVDPLRNLISPLFALASLQDLAFHDVTFTAQTLQISLGDDDLDAISSSWPLLRRLGLLASARPLNEPWVLLPHLSISLSAVATLAVRCPDLKYLALPLLDIRRRRTRPKDTYPSLDHRLRHLQADVICGSDPSTAACILDRLFPRLEVTRDLAKLADLRSRPGIGRSYHRIFLDDERPSAECRALAVRYGLVLGIAVCQDGRIEDPWPKAYAE